MTPNELEAYDAMIKSRDQWRERAERLERFCPSDETPCSTSTPEMDAAAYEATTRTVGKWIVPLAKAREMERQRNIAIAELRRIQNTYEHKYAPTMRDRSGHFPHNVDVLARGESATPITLNPQ